MIFRQYKRTGCFIAVAAIVIIITACNRTQETAEPLTYRLKWLFNISVIGDLYANVHGFFQERGLQVTIKEGGPELDAIKELELGHAHFGVASADQVIRAVSKGAPIVVVAQLFQVNPLQWIYRPDETPITQATDLKGKTLGITYGGNDETIMRTLLEKYGIQTDEVKLFSVRYDYTPFYQHEVDLWPIYRNAEGIIIGDKLTRAGESVRFFSPDEYGVRFVANSIITTDQMLKERPETVQKFVSALMQGWREALEPEKSQKALSTLKQFDKDTPDDLLERQLAVTRKLIQPASASEIGKIDIEAWKQTEAIMLEQKLIPAPVTIEKFLKPIPLLEGK